METLLSPIYFADQSRDETMEKDAFKIYKGLQRPLVFKSFKGKYIYYAAGVLAGGVVIAGIITAVVSSIVGLIALIIVTVPGLLYIINLQKGGLHSKKRETTIFIHKPTYRPNTKSGN